MIPALRSRVLPCNFCNRQPPEGGLILSGDFGNILDGYGELRGEENYAVLTARSKGD